MVAKCYRLRPKLRLLPIQKPKYGVVYGVVIEPPKRRSVYSPASVTRLLRRDAIAWIGILCIRNICEWQTPYNHDLYVRPRRPSAAKVLMNMVA